MPPMKVAKWGNSLALRLPSAVVRELDLSEGDQVHVEATGEKQIQVRRDTRRQELIERIRALSSPLPAGFRFDRDEANER